MDESADFKGYKWYDGMGRALEVARIFMETGKMEFDVSGISSGIYILEIVFESGSAIREVIIE